MIDYVLIIIGLILLTIGFIGCVLPILPGPPISYLGFLALHFSKWGSNQTNLLWILGAMAIIVTLLDYFVPLWGTKKFGGTKFGIWGAAIGLVLGIFWGPIGLIIGPFLGAFLGELTKNSNKKQALKAAFGSFLGVLSGIVLKLISVGLISYYFIKELLN